MSFESPIYGGSSYMKVIRLLGCTPDIDYTVGCVFSLECVSINADDTELCERFLQLPDEHVSAFKVLLSSGAQAKDLRAFAQDLCGLGADE